MSVVLFPYLEDKICFLISRLNLLFSALLESLIYRNVLYFVYR